ncbi:MAG: SDR family NAD(P)-dependent oxidoreductase [Actinomycetota bacterium]|nr:SDR family NAD(P)-dependent oxidoreductase [Actinomycetota bacterium]
MTRVAIVTGGSSGIGRATVQLLEAKGVAVGVLDRNGPEPVDVADRAAVEAGVAAVREAFGPIDIVVNAAGVSSAGRLDDEAYVEEWERAIAVNLTGSMHVVRACLPDLVREGRGRIVNLASTEGLGAARGLGPYTVSKHAVVGFTRSLAVDLGRTGVTANCVCPGATLTGMTAAIPEVDRSFWARRHVPVGRYAAPVEIAYMIVALTEPEASFVNGAIIPVDGGQTAMSM